MSVLTLTPRGGARSVRSSRRVYGGKYATNSSCLSSRAANRTRIRV